MRCTMFTFIIMSNDYTWMHVMSYIILYIMCRVATRPIRLHVDVHRSMRKNHFRIHIAYCVAQRKLKWWHYKVKKICSRYMLNLRRLM